MANTIDFILTTAASELISKVLSGKTLNFTRMAVGDGFSYDTTVAKGYTTLVNEVLSLDITKSETLSASSIKVTSAFKNTDAQKEFYYREVGLYAQDPDTGEEILYAYGNRNDAAELINPSGSSVVTKQLAFIIAVGDSANVTFKVNANVYALQEDVTTLQAKLYELNSTKVDCVTPEMFGAKGDGITDDSNAFENALKHNKVVVLSEKTYAVSKINSEVAENIYIIGNGESTIKWLITDTTKYELYDGMMSDDYGEEYSKHGNVFLKGIIFDGNSDKITNYNTGLRGLCVFWSRNNIAVHDCTFKNSPNDGLMFRDCMGKIDIKNCTFDNIGISNPNDGTRNGMTLSGLSSNIKCCATITNCTFTDIADECMRVDRICALTVQDCVFEQIGQHIVEAGEKNTEYVVKISNCKGDYIGSGVYCQGAHGKGSEKKGLVSIDNCYFSNLAWTNSSAMYKRDAKSTIVNAIGDTPELNGDIKINNSTFISVTEKGQMNTFQTNYGIIGASIALLNAKISYESINVDRFIYPTNTLTIANSKIKVKTTYGYGIVVVMATNVKVTLNNSYVELNGTGYGENNADAIIRVSSSNSKINVDNCDINVGGKSFVHFINSNASEGSVVIVKESKLTGTSFNSVINYDSTETYKPIQLVIVDNIVSNCSWGKIINGTSDMLTCIRNNNYNIN